MSANYFSTCGCFCGCDAVLGPSATRRILGTLFDGHAMKVSATRIAPAAKEFAQKVKSV
jgi:hypothetical protein